MEIPAYATIASAPALGQTTVVRSAEGWRPGWRPLCRRIRLSWQVLALIAVSVLLSRAVVFAGDVDRATPSSQALWISDVPFPSSFISELAPSQLQHSGIPRVALNTGRSNAGVVGKMAFDAAGDLWIPFCGNGNPTSGLVAAFSPATLDQLAAGNNRVKPKAELISYGCPVSVAFDGSGNLWVADGGPFSGEETQSIVEYTAASLSQHNPPQAVVLTSASFLALKNIAFDGAGDLWVALAGTDYFHLYEFIPSQLSAGGMQTAQLDLQSSSFLYPIDLAFDAANNLWVVYEEGIQPESDAGAVQMYPAADLTGSGTIEPAAAVTIGGQGTCSVLTICMPEALAFDQSGNLWISEPFTISEFTPTQLATANPLLAHTILVENFQKGKGRNRNFIGAAALTFGPAAK